MSEADQTIAWMRVGALTFQVCDIINNIPSEVTHIWCSRTTWTKCIYLFIRYYPFFQAGVLLSLLPEVTASTRPTNHQCFHWLVYRAIGDIVIVWAVEIVLIVRVYALYNRNTKILIVLMVVFILDVVASAVKSSTSAPKIALDPNCTLLHAPFSLIFGWVMALAFETLLFALTLLGFLRRSARAVMKGSLLRVLVRDGTWAFASLFAILLINLVVMVTVDGPYGGLFYNWLVAATSSVGSHLILRLRISGSKSGMREFTLSSILPELEAARQRVGEMTEDIEFHTYSTSISHPLES